MPHKTFIAFIWPSIIVMVLFIALPIISVAIQSLFIEHEQVLIQVETSGPFGTEVETRVDVAAMVALRTEQPLGRFNGLGTYADTAHLAFADLRAILSDNAGPRDIFSRMMNLPFYKALIFTLTYTFVVTPLVIVLGFVIAIAVNAVPTLLKGPVIFVSLLPMIVTPLIAHWCCIG
jgi:ABC-type sugar transport system permease subunit